jgi:uncharacterized membrane protein
MSSVPRKHRYLLLLSLALNLGLGAALLSAHWHQQQASTSGMSDRRWARIPSPRMLAGALDEADRKILLEVIETHRGKLGEHFRPLGGARRELAEALRAEPFDPVAMQRAFGRIRESESGTATAMHAFMLDLAIRVSPSGRQRIADQLERGRHGRRHERGETRADARLEPAS